MRVGDSVRSVCGRVRIMFDPAWSRSEPYQIYNEGTQTVNSKTLDKAIEYCKQKYNVQFNKEKIENARKT